MSLRTLAVLCSFLLAAGAAEPVLAQQKVKHVILIGVDGLGSYAFRTVKAPHLRQLMREGSWSLEARTVLPSSSAPNWASMVMGVGPELHGYTTWGSKKPDLPARVLDEYGMFPTVYALLRKARPKAEIGVIYSWEGIGYLFPKAAVNHDQFYGNDNAVDTAACNYIKTQKPDFLFVYFHDVDSVGHNVGHATPEYYASVEKTDAHVGHILQSIRDAGIEDNTVVLFTSDHGGINKGHGSISMEEMQIPWIIRGPGIKANNEITTSIMTFDTAATLAKLLRLQAPQVWIARPVDAAFK